MSYRAYLVLEQRFTGDTCRSEAYRVVRHEGNGRTPYVDLEPSSTSAWCSLPVGICAKDVRFYTVIDTVESERGRYYHREAGVYRLGTAEIRVALTRRVVENCGYNDVLMSYDMQGSSRSIKRLVQLHDMILAGTIRPVVSWDQPQVATEVTSSMDLADKIDTDEAPEEHPDDADYNRDVEALQTQEAATVGTPAEEYDGPDPSDHYDPGVL